MYSLLADIDEPTGLRWRKSSWSAGNGSCVEVADLADSIVGVRNSRDNLPGCPVLTFSSAEWSAFIADVQDGRFDLP